MVLHDGLLQGLDDANFDKVMRPKVLGALLLHQATRDRLLDFFVMISSISAVTGTPGQGNYAAANSFLDHFASYRQSMGLPGLSINWGALGEVEVVARDENLGRLLEGAGVRGMPVQTALQALAMAWGRMLDRSVCSILTGPNGSQCTLALRDRRFFTPWWNVNQCRRWRTIATRDNNWLPN